MDIRRKRGLLWCLGLVAVLLIWQAKASDRVVPVGLELSNNNINAFAYDDEGYMWMGTSRGLNRYNGSFFWTFLHTIEGICHISLWAICPRRPLL